MKRFLSLLAAGGFLLPVLQPARGAEVSLNFFYDNLSGGNWYEVADYGYVWQPDAATDTNWRPYTDGYWAYTDQGWTWVSYEDFGWATYHYGRWARLADYGWVWLPGTEWAPAWVSWRTGGDYVGWAPLPPDSGGEVIYESRPISGEVDIEFGIGPVSYNFVDVRFIGEPVLRDRIVDYNQNVFIVRNTVNVTNITYRNSTVYNYGPDFATVSRYSVRPIQRLKLERQKGDPLQAVKNGNVTKVQGNTLVVAAPQKLQKSTNAQLAPRQVKAKIEQPRVEKGWANIDPNEKTELEQKFKTENRKDVPKPNIQPARETANQSAVAASPAGRPGKGNRKLESAPVTPPAVASSPRATGQLGRTYRNRKGGEGFPATEREGAAENRRGNFDEGNVRRREENKRGDDAPRLGSSGGATENAGDEVKPKSENPSSRQARENEERTNRHEEQQPAQPVQERQAQQNHQMQNAPAAKAPDAGAGPRHRERVQGSSQQPPRRTDQSADQRKRKDNGKKSEEATPPPQ